MHPCVLLLLAAACWQPAAGLNASCTNRAHCHYAEPLSKYVCGFSTTSPAIAGGYPRVDVNGSEMLITNATCATTVVPECAPATASSGDCTGAGACTYVAATCTGTKISDSSTCADATFTGSAIATNCATADGCAFGAATCTTTAVPECAAVDMDTGTASESDCTTAGACTHADEVWTAPNTTYATVFLLCTLGGERGCTGANFGTPECELPAGAVRGNLTAVQRSVGSDPHLETQLLAELGLTAAQFEIQHGGMTIAEFGAQTVSDNWKAAIASLQCETNCVALGDTFEADCLTMANAKGTVKEDTSDGLDLCDHRACRSSLLAIKQALLMDC